MAERMDGITPEEPFQQELRCSVCRDIFKNPLLLPCTHSFCEECLQASAKFGRNRCPLCRQGFAEGQPIPNRVLSDVCQAYAKYPPLGIQKPDGVAGCQMHMKPLVLYCEKDEQPVCVDCVTLHSTHTLRPLTEAVPLCKSQLEEKVTIFERKVESYKKLTQKLESTEEYIRNQAREAEKQIQLEFERLHDALHKEQRLRLSELALEEEQKIAAVQKATETIKEDIRDLGKLIVSVKKEMGNEDLALLQNFHELKRKAQWTREDRCHPEDSLLNVGKHVGALSFKIWKSLQDYVRCNPVVFDPNTSSPWLSLDADLTTVRESSEPLITPDNPERFERCSFVLGSEGYTSGQHRWDVVVGDSPSWVVGVCKEAVARKNPFTLSPNRGVWCIGLSKGVCTVFANERKALQVQQRLERIRIKLNMNEGEVSFWDGENATHLATLQHNFNMKIFPFFGPGVHNTSMILAPGKINMHIS